MKRLFAVVALLGSLAACSDNPAGLVDPARGPAETPPPTLSTAADLGVDVGIPSPADLAAELAHRYVVLFRGRLPRGFEGDVEALGGKVDFSHRAGLAVVSDLSEEGAEEIRRMNGVMEVEHDAVLEMEPLPAANVEAVADPIVTSAEDPTGAYFYARQWNMRAISAQEAWGAGRLGSPGVTVAILDTGIDYAYPDLAGHVDLSRSISFIPLDDAYVAKYFPGSHPITDIGYHGTHVASTVVSNGIVVAGVTSGVTLIGVKVCSVAEGGCPYSAILSGVLFAADAGADVANLSLGGFFEKAGTNGFVGFINMVFSYAESRGMTIVVAAGNDALDMDHDRDAYNAFCTTPFGICVSATGPIASDNATAGPWYEVDAPAPYTNFGRSSVNVAAPGGTKYGFVWGACPTTSLVYTICQTGTYVLGMTGTSMATPHVSGAAALLVEDLGRNPRRIRTTLERMADDLGQPGTDPYYGKGRLNVARAVGIH